MKKNKKRFEKRTAQPVRVDLRTVSDKELFGELVRRLIIKDKRVCYFLDQTNSFGAWDIHTAGNKVLFQINEDEI